MFEEFLDILEKAKGATIGEERTWGGKVYVKTVKGWRPKSKGGKTTKQEDQQGQKISPKEEPSSQDKKAVLEEYAANATDEQLEAAMKKPGQSPEVKEIAKQELESRGKEAEEEADEIGDALRKLINAKDFDDMFDGDLKQALKDKLAEHEEKKKKSKEEKESGVKKEMESLKKEISERLDKIESQIGHKRIKKTGLMVDGKKIFITMKGDRYEAKRGGETLTSEPNESLASFKDKVRKKWEGKLGGEGEKNTEEKTDNLPKTPEINHIVSKLKKIIEESGINKSNIYNVIHNDIEAGRDFALMSLSLGTSGKNSQLQVSASLLDHGKEPVMFPFLFTDYGDEFYDCYDQYFMTPEDALDKYKKNFRPDDEELSDDEEDAMLGYSDGWDRHIRAFNTMSKKDFDVYKKKRGLVPWELDKIKDHTKALESYLKKNRLEGNMILSRRMRFNDDKKNPFLKMNKGDVFVDESFSSFSLQEQARFGNHMQITLLAKKGQQVNAIRGAYPEEMEFLVQRNTKFRVLEVGLRSIAVEIVD